MAQPIRFQATVDRVTRHTADVVSYRLLSVKRLPRFIPGQFIHLTLEPFDPAGFWPESRVFSVGNAVADRRTIDLTISRQGPYTSRILDELDQGAHVWAKGPYGEFTVDASHGYRRVVLIGGGTGITPFSAFLDAALRQGTLPVEQATLYYGARTPDLLIYRPLVDRCATEIEGFTVRYYAEQAHDTSDPHVKAGPVDLAHIMTQTPAPESTAFYLSGPQPMIEAFRDALTGPYRISPTQVLVDAWE